GDAELPTRVVPPLSQLSTVALHFRFALHCPGERFRRGRQRLVEGVVLGRRAGFPLLGGLVLLDATNRLGGEGAQGETAELQWSAERALPHFLSGLRIGQRRGEGLLHLLAGLFAERVTGSFGEFDGSRGEPAQQR